MTTDVRIFIVCNNPHCLYVQVENFINRHFKDKRVCRVLPHHAAIDPEIRQKNLKDFLKPPEESSLILVCTDRASRGESIPFSSLHYLLVIVASVTYHWG